jgi:hypothetical protein
LARSTGTDANRDESSVRTGSYSVVLENTAVATKIRSAFIPVQNGVEYLIAVHALTDNITWGITIKVEKYSGLRALFGTDTISASFTTVSTWEWLGDEWTSAFTGWIRITIEKTANTHHVYLDRVIAERGPARLEVRKLNTQGISTSTWTTVEYETAQEYGFTKSGTLYICKVPGYYTMSASVHLDDLSDTTIAAIRIKVDDGVSPVYYYGTRFGMPTTMEPILLISVEPILLLFGYTIEVEVWHNEGSSVNAPNFFAGTDRGSHFGATRSERM